jgi:UDP-glucose:(heptosyl)LPS alpha-1,3-glucosyltransferase
VISLERTYCQEIYRAGDGCHREWLLRKGVAAGPLKRFFIPLNPLHTVLLHLEKRLFSDPGLKMVVANSKSVKRDIIRHYGLPEEKICVIYNGIDAGRIAPVSHEEKARLRVELGIEAGMVTLLFVGSGFERKGLRYLIRAMGLLRDVDVRLIVVGKGRTSDYEREALKAGAVERVSFKGPVKSAIKYYQASDIFVLPTLYEPFSNACLEAMATGLPVVTSIVNGASEVISDGESGAVVDDPTDHVALAGRIREFMSADKRASASVLARKAAEALTIEKNVDAFMQLIDDIARKDKRLI